MNFGGIAVLVAILSGTGTGTSGTVSTHSILYSGTSLVGQQVSRDEGVKTFFGSIVKDGDKFVLSDEKRKIWYELDDQQTVSKFDGKKVKLTGTLDTTKNLIRVQSIEEAST